MCFNPLVFQCMLLRCVTTLRLTVVIKHNTRFRNYCLVSSNESLLHVTTRALTTVKVLHFVCFVKSEFSEKFGMFNVARNRQIRAVLLQGNRAMQRVFFLRPIWPCDFVNEAIIFYYIAFKVILFGFNCRISGHWQQNENRKLWLIASEKRYRKNWKTIAEVKGHQTDHVLLLDPRAPGLNSSHQLSATMKAQLVSLCNPFGIDKTRRWQEYRQSPDDVGSRAATFKRPLLSVDVSLCLCVGNDDVT